MKQRETHLQNTLNITLVIILTGSLGYDTQFQGVSFSVYASTNKSCPKVSDKQCSCSGPGMETSTSSSLDVSHLQ